MMDTDTTVIQERSVRLCREFKMSTMGAQSVVRFTQAGRATPCPLSWRCWSRKPRILASGASTACVRRPSSPRAGPGRPFEHHRMPLALWQQIDHLAQGSFVEHGVNGEAEGQHGTGKTRALCPLGYRLVEAATPSSSHRPTDWCRA